MSFVSELETGVVPFDEMLAKLVDENDSVDEKTVSQLQRMLIRMQVNLMPSFCMLICMQVSPTPSLSVCSGLVEPGRVSMNRAYLVRESEIEVFISRKCMTCP